MAGSTKDVSPAEPEHRHRRAGQRACRACGVRLSAYNPNPYCWQHMIGQPWRGPTAKPKF